MSCRARSRSRSRSRSPKSIVYDRKAAAGKLAYLHRFLSYMLRADRVDVIICGHCNLLAPAWLLARLQRAHLVLVIHGLEAWGPSRDRIVNWLASRVDGLISVSRLSAERFSRWSNFPAERAFILPNCVDLKRFRPQPKDPALMERYGLRSSRVIMTVGRLASLERKGVDEVIKSMPRLVEWQPTIKYIIVGDGSDRPRLEAKVKSLKMSNNVIFAGRVSESEKVAHYNLADAYAMPSRGEGFGIVLIEAAACGIPVIGSDRDGSRETLFDGKLGCVIDPTDTKQLFDAICAALSDPGAGAGTASSRRSRTRISRAGSSSGRKRLRGGSTIRNGLRDPMQKLLIEPGHTTAITGGTCGVTANCSATGMARRLGPLQADSDRGGLGAVPAVSP